MNIKFNIMIIKSVHSAKERTVAYNTFNDSGSLMKILLCSLKIISVSVNLQRSCFDVVFLNILINDNILL